MQVSVCFRTLTLSNNLYIRAALIRCKNANLRRMCRCVVYTHDALKMASKSGAHAVNETSTSKNRICDFFLKEKVNE